MIVSFITFLNWIGSSCREEILLSSNSFLGSTHLIVFLPCCVSICLLIHLLWWDDNSVSTYFQILIFPPQNFSEPCYQVKEEREKLSCFGLMLQIKTKQKVKSFWEEDNLLDKDCIRVLSATPFGKFHHFITLEGVCASNTKAIIWNCVMNLQVSGSEI